MHLHLDMRLGLQITSECETLVFPNRFCVLLVRLNYILIMADSMILPTAIIDARDVRVAGCEWAPRVHNRSGLQLCEIRLTFPAVRCSICNLGAGISARSNAKYCQHRIAEGIFQEVGGWVTQQSSGCVNIAISYALHKLASNGTIDQMMLNYFPELSCKDTSTDMEVASFESSGTEMERRRRLTSFPAASRFKMPSLCASNQRCTSSALHASGSPVGASTVAVAPVAVVEKLVKPSRY